MKKPAIRSVKSHSQRNSSGSRALTSARLQTLPGAQIYELRHRLKVLAHAGERLQRAVQPSAFPQVAKGLQAFLRLEDERLQVANRLGASGEWIARARSFVIDVLVKHVMHVAENNSIAGDGISALPQPSGELVRTKGLAVMALGGYGRNELSPFSDVDLLFLYSSGPSKQSRQTIERCLHLLWDAGLNVGQKSFSVADCIPAARHDPHFQTALVTLRFVAGDASLPERLVNVLERERQKNGDALIETVKGEREARYQKRTAAIYLQEPNLKESAGGLRDLHSALWAAYACYGYSSLSELWEHGLIDDHQYAVVSQAYDFLLRLRHLAHWTTGRKTDHLALDLQETLAQKCGYSASTHLQASEQLMRDYYRQARELHQFGDLLVARATERREVPRRWFAKSRRESLDALFSIEDGRLFLEGNDGLRAPDPLIFFQALTYAQSTGTTFSHDLRNEIRRGLVRIDRQFRTSREAAGAFLSMIRQPGKVGRTLRLMHDVGLLGRYLPEFGRISFLIQHDLYHHYTVDEHTLRTIEALDDLYHSRDKQRAPLRATLAEVKDVSLLYLALLLHDIGKGRGRGHIPRGARIARPICQRLHLDSKSTSQVVQLVQQHVYMAHVSQRRDLGEDRLAAAFAAQVGNLNLLNMLYLLTYADLNGVGPGVWSEWKGNLLHELYVLAREVLSPGSPVEVTDNVELVKEQVIKLLLGKVPLSEIERHFALLPARYARLVTADAVATHLTLIAQLGTESLACGWRECGMGTTELTICARDCRGLFGSLYGSQFEGDV